MAYFGKKLLKVGTFFCMFPCSWIHRLRKPHNVHFCTDTLAKLLTKCAHVVMGHQLIVHINHSIIAYVHSKTFALTSQRQIKLDHQLTQPNITYTAEGTSNSADGLAQDGVPHHCIAKSESVLRTDLSKTPFIDSLHLFTDGHSHRDQTTGNVHAGAAVVLMDKGPPPSPYKVSSWGPISGHSAQYAELQAVVLALQYAGKRDVTIYTDSAYVYGLIHHDLACFKRNGFLNAKGEPVAHLELCETLCDFILEPNHIAVVKVPGHCCTNHPDPSVSN